MQAASANGMKSQMVKSVAKKMNPTKIAALNIAPKVIHIPSSIVWRT